VEETRFLAVMELLWKQLSRCHAPVQKRQKKLIRMNELTGDDSEIAKWKYEMVQTASLLHVYLFKPQRWELQRYLFLSMSIYWCSLLPHAVPSKICLF